MADTISVATAAEEAANPYYPIGSSIAGYQANESSVPALLGVFFGTCIVVFSCSHTLAKRIQPDLRRGELLTMMWFILSGCIHIVFEGYYITHYASLGSKQTLLGQMWKEYAFSDSR
jgi:cholestenol delta-isomerase